MLETTVGQLLINRALPPDLQDYGRVLDKKGQKELLRQLALQHPDKYRDVSKRLADIGRRVAQEEGGFSFGPEHVARAKAAVKIRAELQDKIAQILGNNKLTPQQRRDQLVLQVGDVKKRLIDAVYRESLDEDNPIALQILSGARGNELNLASLRASDLLYADAQGHVIPVPVLKSYSEGLTPLEYWAGSFGARQGVIATKFATADAGFFGKQMNQAAHRLVVVDEDAPPELDEHGQPVAGPVRGLPMATDDPDNEGALLAHPAGPYQRDTVLTPKILRHLQQLGHRQILLRSPAVSGAPNGGVYARDVGVRERGTLPGKGELVGNTAAQAISEPLSQGMLGTKHVGGVAGEAKTMAGFDYINSLVQVPTTFKGAAALAERDGRVSSIRPAPAGGTYVTIDGQEHYVARGYDVTVKKGDQVEAGDVLSDGIPNPQLIAHHKGLGEGKRYFVTAMRQAMKDSGITAHRRNLELLSRGLVGHVRLTDELGDWVPDDVIPYYEIERTWRPRAGFQRVAPAQAVGQYLEQPVLHHTIGTKVKPSMLAEFATFGIKELPVHRQPPPFAPEMVRAMQNLHHDPDWMTRMYGSDLKKGLQDSVHRGGVSDEAGTSFVPGLARAVDFGRQGVLQPPQPGKPLPPEGQPLPPPTLSHHKRAQLRKWATTTGKPSAAATAVPAASTPPAAKAAPAAGAPPLRNAFDAPQPAYNKPFYQDAASSAAAPPSPSSPPSPSLGQGDLLQTQHWATLTGQQQPRYQHNTLGGFAHLPLPGYGQHGAYEGGYLPVGPGGQQGDEPALGWGAPAGSQGNASAPASGFASLTRPEYVTPAEWQRQGQVYDKVVAEANRQGRFIEPQEAHQEAVNRIAKADLTSGIGGSLLQGPPSNMVAQLPKALPRGVAGPPLPPGRYNYGRAAGGTALGATASGAFDALSQYYHTGTVDLGQTAKATAEGAIAVPISGVLSRAGLGGPLGFALTQMFMDAGENLYGMATDPESLRIKQDAGYAGLHDAVDTALDGNQSKARRLAAVAQFGLQNLNVVSNAAAGGRAWGSADAQRRDVTTRGQQLAQDADTLLAQAKLEPDPQKRYQLLRTAYQQQAQGRWGQAAGNMADYRAALSGTVADNTWMLTGIHQQAQAQAQRRASLEAGVDENGAPLTPAQRAALQQAYQQNEQALLHNTALAQQGFLGDVGSTFGQAPDVGTAARTTARQEALSLHQQTAAMTAALKNRQPAAGPLDPELLRQRTTIAEEKARSMTERMKGELGHDAWTKVEGGAEMWKTLHQDYREMADIENMLELGQDFRGAALSEAQQLHLNRRLNALSQRARDFRRRLGSARVD